MPGTFRVNRNKLLRVNGEAAAAELVGVAYARASKPTNTSAASCLGAGGHNYKGVSASAVLARLAGGNSRHQGHDEDLQMAVKLRNCRRYLRFRNIICTEFYCQNWRSDPAPKLGGTAAVVGVGGEEGAGGEGLPRQQSRRGRGQRGSTTKAAELARKEPAGKERLGWRLESPGSRDRARGRIAEVGGGKGACGRRRSGWSRRWAASQLGGKITQLGAGRSRRIEDQIAWWSRRWPVGGCGWAASAGISSTAAESNGAAGDARAPDGGSRRSQGHVCYCFKITRCFLQKKHCTARATRIAGQREYLLTGGKVCQGGSADDISMTRSTVKAPDSRHTHNIVYLKAKDTTVKVSPKTMLNAILAEMGLSEARFKTYTCEHGLVGATVYFWQSLEPTRVCGEPAANIEEAMQSAATKCLEHLAGTMEVEFDCPRVKKMKVEITCTILMIRAAKSSA